MTLIEELVTNHTDKHGGYLEKPGGKPSQNQVLFLVHALWELWLAGEDVAAGLKCWDRFMDATYMEKGRFRRRPKSNMLNSHDNYTGMAAGCYLWRLVMKKPSKWEGKIRALGKRAWNYGGAKLAMPPWNLLKSQLKPNDIGFIKLCLKKRPNLLERKAIVINAKTSESWNLARLRAIVLAQADPKGEAFKVLKKRDYTKDMKAYYRSKGNIVLRAYLANGGKFKK